MGARSERMQYVQVEHLERHSPYRSINEVSNIAKVKGPDQNRRASKIDLVLSW
jgi:hypothetical protein